MAKKRKTGTAIMNGHYKVDRFITRSPTYRKMPWAARVLFIHLVDLRNELNLKKPMKYAQFFQSDLDIMRDIGISRATLRHARRCLIANDFICVDLGRYTGEASSYIILDDCSQEQVECDWPF